MRLLPRRILLGSVKRRSWWIGVLAILSVAGAMFILGLPMGGTRKEPIPASTTGPATTGPAASSTFSTVASPTAASAVETPPAISAPRTTDYRRLASAAATAIYTWDTRTASYSEVYSRLRDWWDVLPDGSNPLTVFVQEFEATGVNAGTYATLAGEQARRSATVQSLVCDGELAKVRDHPAPWVGLHVCTAILRVVDQSNSDRNAYAAPVSVMVNCPPATTAPIDHCVVVGFYATPSRIVY
ncbi:hypothetical protein BMF89_16545 [Arthrobacter sp. SRS-W-1-2016]|uniref:hypothetical protein n=1 Tax=Arthrobacter sp. SRS-W-1-2016 TaxID=1930254 RepID=UPI000990D983|nr:hypothetical protein [Arthrobacter sp. SRS-W-1-2016]OOP60478.1 hypothetical protein BMF89_16545 [Arthrobacter sp. SRS-W-1-2016]